MAHRNVLVTGGAGFIGSHVARHHLALGDSVWVVDNLQAGRLSNIEPFKSNPKFQFDQAPVQAWPKLKEAVKWADRIYNIAGNVGQRLILSNPTATMSNNIRVLEAVLEAMVETGSQARIITASTSEMYINSEENPDGTVSEDALVIMPSGKFLQESYPISKLANEIDLLSYAHTKNIHGTIARIFNTIGTNQSAQYGMVVPTFIEQATSGKPLTIYGDGLQTRSFSDARDTVTALQLLLDNPKSKGEIVNVGDDRECSILDLAKLVLKTTQSKSEIRYLTYEEAYGVADFEDVRRRCPDLRKLRQMTGFHPKYALKDTIEEIYHQKMVGSPR